MEFTKDIQFDINPTANENLTITYNGFLKNSQDVSIVYGYGEAWENTSEIKMEKTENGFVGTINLLNYDTFNFCFKNSSGEWDNNSYCNYITGIAPAIEQTQNFDIDALIEELLFEPINSEFTNFEENNIAEIQQLEENIISNQQEENIDLAYQLSNLISQIEPSPVELVEYSTLDEILTATKIENVEIGNTDVENNISENFLKDISLFDFNGNNIQSDILENTTPTEIESKQYVNTQSFNNIVEENNAIFEDFINNLSSITAKHQINGEENQDSNNETALIETSDSFIVSSRQASKFYLFRKRIKLALYKAFVKLPKMLLGIENEEK